MGGLTPLSKFDLPTPALVVDLDCFERNLARMAERAASRGKRLRPHVKAHKCVEIARRQVILGAAGICAATLSEVEWLAASGITNILLTTPVADSRKASRLLNLAASGLSVVVDHPSQAEMYGKAAAAAGALLDVLVDLDIGDHRTGAVCGEPALALVKQVDAASHLRFAGLQAYSVAGSHQHGFEERRRLTQEALGEAIGFRREIEREGIEVPLLTGASTGTWDIDAEIDGLDELQAGSYALMDLAYRRMEIAFDPAARILATVISANHADRVTVDAGYKAFATDRPFGPEPLDLTGVRWQWAGDEFGFLHLESPSRPVRLGDKIEFLAPHCDPTCNLYDRMYVCRGSRVEAGVADEAAGVAKIQCGTGSLAVGFCEQTLEGVKL
jgi:D-serine deaminase-like pyridoxal phosphate-dependent protein